MKILKTTALATILALGSLSANAGYDGTDNFEIKFVTAVQLGVAMVTDITFNNMTEGDIISSDSINVVITGQVGTTGLVAGGTARTILCALTSVGGANTITNGDTLVTAATVGVRLSGLSANPAISTLTLTLSACAIGAQTLTITSDAVTGSAPGTSYTTGVMTFTASYIPITNVNTHGVTA
ncbi:MAG: hypothetical protein HOM96_04995 [Rickettsiales bacterium]|jgi:hypothetical protein|nr:hypothetical protein [Rickettsiales bacterium]